MALTLEEAACIVAAGGVVVYPTETLWGIGGDACRPDVTWRVLAAKRIFGQRPFPVLASSMEQVRRIVPSLDGLEELAEAFWPGALTLVVPVRERSLAHLQGPSGGVGLRISANPVATALAEAAGGLLVSTSANFTGQPPPTTLAEVSPLLLDATDGAVEWSGTCGGKPSTLLVCEPWGWVRGRSGAIDDAALRAVLGGRLLLPSKEEEPA